VGDWWQGITDAIGGDIAIIWQAIIALAQAIASVFAYLWKLIQDIFNFLVSVLRKVGQFLHTLWDGFFKRIFTGLYSALVKLHQWLEARLRPLLTFLTKVRAYWDRLFKLYVKPLLNMIQHVRQFLGVLRLLGVKWAAALDAKLGKFESDIAGLFLQVRAILTGTIDILNALADPLNLFRRPTAVLSMRRIIPALVKVTTGLPLGYFMPSPRKGAPLGLGFLPDNFNPADPSQNPPASSYFAFDDGLGTFSGFANGVTPDDSAVDDLTILDYFDDGLYGPPLCNDAASCLAVLQAQAYAGIVKGAAS
jgi:hypothetical protein